MKIDLHCHTKAVRRGELATRNVTKEIFRSKVTEANVKIVAITNHDIFDRPQFEEFQNETEGSSSLWPGVEFNVIHDDEKYHMIIVGSPCKLDNFETAVASATSGKSGEFDVTLDEILTSFSGLDVIYLPHYGNKTPGISLRKLSDLYGRVRNKNMVILEDSNSRSTAILSSMGFEQLQEVT